MLSVCAMYLSLPRPPLTIAPCPWTPPLPPPHSFEGFNDANGDPQDPTDPAGVNSGLVFRLSGNRLALAAPFDYERRESYMVNVSVVDRAGPTGFVVSVIAIINVGDVNDVTGA